MTFPQNTFENQLQQLLSRKNSTNIQIFNKEIIFSSIETTQKHLSITIFEGMNIEIILQI